MTKIQPKNNVETTLCACWDGIGIPIVGGDFNETLKSIDRKTSRSNQNNQPVSSFKNLIKSNKLVDIWRYLNENIQ
jgi:hypothetical protein